MSIVVSLASGAVMGQMGLGALRAPLFLPPGLSAVLFENQPMLWIAAVVLGVILLQQGRSRGQRNVSRSGVVVIALTGVWIIAAALFLTPRERLYADHEVLAKAAAAGDVHTIVSFFGDDFALPAMGIDNAAQAKVQIGQRLKSYQIRSLHLSNYQVELYPPTATTKFTVTAVTAEYPAVPTTWQLTWRDVAGADWRIEKADLLRIGNEPASRLPGGGG